MLSLQPLHEPSGPFLRRHVEGDTRKLAVDVERTLQLEEVPVLHDHLGLGPRHPVLEKRSISNVCCLCGELHSHASDAGPYLFDDIIEENDLSELHSEIVLVGARLQVADHRRSNAEGRHQEAGEEEVGRGACLRVHQQQRHILLGNPLEQVQHHQRVQVFLQGDIYSINDDDDGNFGRRGYE